MTEEYKAYEETITNVELMHVGFKLPKALYDALQVRMQRDNYRDGWGNYYFHLVSYEFYEQYRSLFYEIQEGIAPIPKSMEMRDLPDFGISNEYSWEVMSHKMESKPIMIYQLPITHLQVCRHLGTKLHYIKSDALLYRFFTIKILINKLQDELNDARQFPI